jgi:hypothetical protein
LIWHCNKKPGQEAGSANNPVFHQIRRHVSLRQCHRGHKGTTGFAAIATEGRITNPVEPHEIGEDRRERFATQEICFAFKGTIE